MAHLEKAWTVNYAIGRLSRSWVKLTKSLQQVSNPKMAGSLELRPKLKVPVYHNNIVNTLKIYLCPSHIVQVLWLPGAVSPDLLLFAARRITLTDSEVVGTENWVTFIQPFLLGPSSMAKMQS